MEQKKWGWGSYITAGIIWTLAKNKNNNEIVILVVALTAGVLFYPTERKLARIKNASLRKFCAGAILTLLAAAAIGFFTPFADAL